MLRLIFGLLFAFVLSVTSVTAAVARGQMAGASELVLCSGGVAATVMVDATGRKVEGPHHCPLCLAAMAGVGPVAPWAVRPVTRPVPALPEGAALWSGAALRGFAARGPPRAA